MTKETKLAPKLNAIYKGKNSTGSAPTKAINGAGDRLNESSKQYPQPPITHKTTKNV